MENPIQQLKNKISDLTESQRKVADYIIKNPVDVAFLTVDQLAGLVGTSTTTIMRLTFSLGYSGYSEFQKGLQELLRNRADPHTRLATNLKDLNRSDLWVRCAENHINNIQSTAEMVSPDTLNKTLEMIVSADRIYCTGVRSSMPVAQCLHYGLNRLLGNCDFLIADHGGWTERVTSMSESDLVIAASFPRYARSVLQFVKAAKENGAKVISITDSYSSPLVTYSDLILPTNVGSVAFHNSVIAPMFVADYIISAVAINYSDKTKHRLEKMDLILKGLNYHYLD